MKISIIHASYGRPVLAKQTYDHWRHAMGNVCTVNYLLSVDLADPMFDQYMRAFDHRTCVIENKTKTSVEAINRAAHFAIADHADIIIVISDDFSPPAAWDELILKAVKGKSDFILKTQDGTQGWMITLPIMDRVYYNRFGYVYNPEYKHMFCDTELTCVADLLGRKIESDIMFRHKHYSTKDGIPKDGTSIKADATWQQGEEVFLKHYKENFGLINPAGKITDTGMKNWIERKLK